MQLILVGGFLGAGKTTAITQAALHLQKQGINVAVVTNDQGDSLVDTKHIQNHSIAVGEVTGGCFCCNYNQLATVLEQFNQDIKPTLVFAESVGSCTDLVATVIKPMQEYSPDIVVNLSVFADAVVLYAQLQAKQFLFQNNVHYIYQKQLEEADSIIVNKTDLLPSDRLEKLQQLMKLKYPNKLLIFQNSYSETDVQHWIQTVINQSVVERISLDIDYEQYGAGEAVLAWLDADLLITSSNAVAVGNLIVDTIKKTIKQHQWPIGHLKFMLKGNNGNQKISFTANGVEEFQSVSLGEEQKLHLLINARVQCEPTELYAIVHEVISTEGKKKNIEIEVLQMKYFKPGFPTPTHRIEC